MDNSLRSVVELQVRRVHRRLLLRSLMHSLVLCGSAALLLAALWFVVRPFAFAGAGDAWRWGVPAAFLGLATIASIVLGWVRTPNMVASALALDEQFGVRTQPST